MDFHKKTLLRFMSTTLCLLAVGCASYVPPTQGPTARLRIVNDSPGKNVQVSAMEYPHRCMSNWNSGNPITRLGFVPLLAQKVEKQSLQMPLAEVGEDSTEVIIPADKPFTIMLSGGFNVFNGSINCNYSFKFFPKSNEDYEAQYKFEANQCIARLYRIAKNNESNGFIKKPEAAVPLEKC